MLGLNKIYNMDCLEGMKRLPDNSIDAVVTDPPYGLSFMGKKWDYDVPTVEIWKECLRVLKPGGYLLAFAGTRTQHRMAVRIEDAGFEIRDMIAWVYGSGFPKSLNIGKAVDKLQGNEREDLGYNDNSRTNKPDVDVYEAGIRGKESRLSKGYSQWEGWGTALKPALEPITVARKPLEGTVAENCLKWGVGGINIDGCRVGMSEQDKEGSSGNWKPKGYELKDSIYEFGTKVVKTEQPSGRFPANFIHDGSDEVVGLFPNCKGWSSQKHNSFNPYGGNALNKSNSIREGEYEGYNDSGSAARFFYCAKASKSERNTGCEDLEKKNNHPTVKPIAVMEYLINLVSREGHVILDPFSGSGTTAIAAFNKGRNFIGFEISKEYCEIAKRRVSGGI